MPPAGYIFKPLEQRFVEKVTRGAADECWPWLGFVDKGGYGRIRVGRGRLGESGYAHRVSYELNVGPIPNGLTLDHLCRNRSCVNPTHLEPVTATENVRRGAGSFVLKTGKCARGHDQTIHAYVSPKGRRSCKACRKLRDSWAAA